MKTEEEKPVVPSAMPSSERLELNQAFKEAGFLVKGDLICMRLYNVNVWNQETTKKTIRCRMASWPAPFGPDGLRLECFRKNPIVLYGHDYKGLPIARSLWERLRVNWSWVPTLTVKLRFHLDTELSREVWESLRGHPDTWTAEVGVVPTDWTGEGRDIKVTKFELLEISLVRVPVVPPSMGSPKRRTLDQKQCEVYRLKIDEVLRRSSSWPTGGYFTDEDFEAALNTIEDLRAERAAVPEKFSNAYPAIGAIPCSPAERAMYALARWSAGMRYSDADRRQRIIGHAEGCPVVAKKKSKGRPDPRARAEERTEQ